MNTETQIPDGYRRNHLGHLVPTNVIADIDLLRDQSVQKLVGAAREESARIAAFKSRAFTDVHEFCTLSAEQYGVKWGGAKGNISLVSFDGLCKVELAIAETIEFDERLQTAKQIIDGCIERWASGADPRLLAIVNDAFRVNNSGAISTSRILALKRLEIDDAEWQQAMRAIGDGITGGVSKPYIRFYQRATTADQWCAIPIDIAAAKL